MLNLGMNELEVLFDLIDFELVVLVADGAVDVRVVICAVGGVEEVVPAELLVVLGEVFGEGKGGMLRDAQLEADCFD